MHLVSGADTLDEGHMMRLFHARVVVPEKRVQLEVRQHGGMLTV